jgi:hypothetical protein
MVPKNESVEAEKSSDMNIGGAIRWLKDGYPVARKSWPEGKTIWMFEGSLNDDRAYEHLRGVPNSLFGIPSTGTVNRMPSICQTEGTDPINSSWSATDEDLLAEDWFRA